MAFDYKAETMRLFGLLVHVTDKDEQIRVRNQVIEMNIKLVSVVLKKYRPYSEDNFQVGCIGLINAAQTYQLKKEVPFSSYACFCIERELQLAHNKVQRHIETQVGDSFISLDSEYTLPNGDVVTNADVIFDESAELELNSFVEDNELTFICDTIIKPCIEKVADKGSHMTTKLNVSEWKRLEFAYIMDLIYIDSQKQRFNLTQFAKRVGVSVQNVRTRHTRVMEEIFQGMWEYMTLSFSDLLDRLRRRCKVPERLLVFDPGKTTGWSLFEQGKLTKSGQITDCYDDKNIDATGIIALMEEISPDFVLYEDYRVYSHKLDRHSYSQVHTLRLIGTIETLCQIKNIPTHKQMAVTAKGFVTDEKLKQWGFYKKGEQHARDSIRHGCYFLLFYKKGQDIL